MKLIKGYSMYPKIINNYSKYFLENLKHLANNYTFKFTYLLVLNYSR